MSSTIFLLLLFFAEGGFITSPSQSRIEPTISNMVMWFRLTIETIGALILTFGAVLAIYEFIRLLFFSKDKNYNEVRLLFARYLTLALEFQLGADILATAIAPTWEQIGKLAAIAVIRTGLNYFLSLEMRHERKLSDNGNKTGEEIS